MISNNNIIFLIFIGRAKGTPDGMWTGMVGELMKDEADMGNFLAYRKVLKE